MVVLARKITRPKWDPKPGLATGEIGADAVTADLRTSDDALSFWRCDSESYHHLNAAALALAAAAERPDRLDLTWLDRDAVVDAGLSVESSDGDTPVVSLRGRHVDVQHLDYHRLGKLAGLIAGALAENRFRRLSQGEVVGLLADAVCSSLVSLSDLKERVRKPVEQRLQSAK